MSNSDSTNYETYKLLASYGLSKEQLITVARTEMLHELRILRMLRLVFNLTLQEAQQVLMQVDIS